MERIFCTYAEENLWANYNFLSQMETDGEMERMSSEMERMSVRVANWG